METYRQRGSERALSRILIGLVTLGAISCGDNGGDGSAYVPQTRTYFLAAEHVEWNYAPLGMDPVFNQPIPEPYGEQLLYEKIRYVQYTDATFTTQIAQPNWLGILGPIIRGVVGDTLKVTFLNRTDRHLSIHPHGVKYDKDSEGASYGPQGLGSEVAPDEQFTYTWEVDAGAGPAPGEPSSKVWLYHSHVDEVQDVLDGLVGTIIVTDAAKARDDGTPTDVDREFVTLFLIFDQNAESGGHGGGAGEEGDGEPTEEELREGNLKHAINGLIFGNLPGLEMNMDDRVRWYVVGLGDEPDLHTPHWHGETAILDGRTRTDVVELLPASMHVVDMVTDNPGTWLFHCHVAGHVEAGMYTTFVVR